MNIINTKGVIAKLLCMAMKRLEMNSFLQVVLTSGRKVRSLTFCLAPMIILMTDCAGRAQPPAPFAPSNEGRDVVACMIDKEEYVDWDVYKHHLSIHPSFYVYYSKKDNDYVFHTECMSINFYVKDVEPLKAGVKYSISENSAHSPLVSIKYSTVQSNYESVSGYIKFRHISEKVISGNFECQMKKASESNGTTEPEQIHLTYGTFDLRRDD